MARWPDPDFLPRRLRPPLLAWALLVCSALVLGQAVDDWLALGARRDEAQRQLARWQPAPRVAARSLPRLEPDKLARAAKAAQVLSQRLAFPWQDLFEVTERDAPPDVSWVRLEHDSERGELRLEATAPHRDAVLATLAALAAEPQWRDLMLVRVEAVSVGGAGTGPVPALRFELRASQARQVAEAAR